ncbi:hypothetical protein Lgra_3313 [Legionella gratiana]|uniref:Uncharacterized protein n=1 Tax=Legionella gratiana TaxID=45066 RepID=A0A378JEN9_9GAMM|nr:hypothetical protein [Legionella gratiana]KTD06536.1 hypothetical protein Lgra_3313 [Legionella gratiana]STX45357.1 Uncharacterised protein [Legionella gratiana]
MLENLLLNIGNLSQCGRHWGKEVDLSQITHFSGKFDSLETSINGVLGLNGNEPGQGPFCILHNIENSPIDMIWTTGLTGCMGLAITGRDSLGQLNVFFSHARHYDKADAAHDEENPIYWARRFIQQHQDVRIFWGSDFFFGTRYMYEGTHHRQQAQIKLSNALGCWVRLNDSVISKELVFLPKLGLLKPGRPSEVYVQLEKEKDLQHKIAFSQSKCLRQFEFDRALKENIDQQLQRAKKARNKSIRFYFQDQFRDTQIAVLQLLSDAYHVGNFDIIQYLAVFARKKESPFSGPKTGISSNTAKLILAAFEDSLEKIRNMNQNGCGLAENGFQISYKQFLKLTNTMDSSEFISYKG